MPDVVRCTGCNWDVPADEIVWSEERNGEKFALCSDCSDSDEQCLTGKAANDDEST